MTSSQNDDNDDYPQRTCDALCDDLPPSFGINDAIAFLRTPLSLYVSPPHRWWPLRFHERWPLHPWLHRSAVWSDGSSVAATLWWVYVLHMIFSIPFVTLFENKCKFNMEAKWIWGWPLGKIIFKNLRFWGNYAYSMSSIQVCWHVQHGNGGFTCGSSQGSAKSSPLWITWNCGRLVANVSTPKRYVFNEKLVSTNYKMKLGMCRGGWIEETINSWKRSNHLGGKINGPDFPLPKQSGVDDEFRWHLWCANLGQIAFSTGRGTSMGSCPYHQDDTKRATCGQSSHIFACSGLVTHTLHKSMFWEVASSRLRCKWIL